MKKINLFIGIFIMMMGFSSCDDWFDVSPKTDIKADDLFQDENGFRDVLTGVYSLMTTTQTYGCQLTFGYTDVLAQYYNKINNPSHQYYKTVSFNYNEPIDESTIANIWSVQYKAIANLNTFLHFAKTNQDAFNTETIRCIYTGEAYALRAFLHFDLLRLFGPVPETGMDQKSIPYMEEFTNVAGPCLPASEVLKKIVSDIETARDLMRDFDSFGPNYDKLFKEYQSNKQLRNRSLHMNYYAATALLARVQLYAGNKAEALKAAQEIIGKAGSNPVRPFMLARRADVSDRLFVNELMFALQIPDLEDVIDPYFGKQAYESGLTNSSKILAFGLKNRDNLFMAEHPSDDDFRLKLWFRETGSSDALMSGKLQKQTMIPLIRVSELYYIASECSEGEDAWEYLNKIRAHRGLAPLEDVEDEDLDFELYTEYCREFMNEGQVFYYFKRKNMPQMGVYKSRRINPEKVYTLPMPVGELDYGNKN